MDSDIPHTPAPARFDRRGVLRGVAGAGLATGAFTLLGERSSASPLLVHRDRPLLPFGVQSGDVRAGSALLWSKADRPSRLVAEISRDADFRRVRKIHGPVVTPASDLTGTVALRGLPAGTDVHYRIRAIDLHSGRVTSAPGVGRFRTAPGDRDDVRFLWSGDIAGQGWGVNPEQGDPGAPLGREVDIARVLSALSRFGIRNHVWLTADVHYTAAHHYSPDRAAHQDFDPFWEFVSGPLNAGAFGPNKLDGTFGPVADFVAAPPVANTSPAVGHQYFGEVEIDGVSGRLTVTLRDVVGAAIYTRTLDPAPR